MLKFSTLAAPCFFLLISCASFDPKVPAKPDQTPTENVQPHGLSVPEYPDQICDGDLLFVQREDDLKGVKYRVSDSGVFYYPYIGKVTAAGRTPGEVAALMTRSLQATFKRPEVTVNIAERSGNQIFIGGEVKNNGVYPLNSNLTLSQAIFMAGGFSEYAATDQIVLLRLAADQRYNVFIFNFSSITDIERNQRRPLRVMRGDIVYVPRNRIGNAVRFVDQYIRGLVPFNMAVGAFYQIDAQRNAVR